MTITLDLPDELNAPLQAAARIQGKDVAAFLLDNARQQLRKDVLSEPESQLLLRLQALFPFEQVQEYQSLCEKSDSGSISPLERERLIFLVEQRDLQNAERLEIAGALAQLRNLSLRETMRQLEIQPE